jgi:hypothetical protein
MFHDQYTSNTLKDIIQLVLDNDYEVFEFEDEGEFGAWVVELNKNDGNEI